MITKATPIARMPYIDVRLIRFWMFSALEKFPSDNGTRITHSTNKSAATPMVLIKEGDNMNRYFRSFGTASTRDDVGELNGG